MSENDFGHNAILAQLPDAEFAALRPHLWTEQSEIKRPGYEPGEPITDIFFPLTSVFSLVAMTNGQIQLEVATVGHEGMVGLPVYLGATASPQAAFCQVPGETVGMSVDDFRAALVRDGVLHRLLNRFTQAIMVQVSQNVVCNRSHPAEARMARWLATTHDRVRRDEFLLTQEFIAQMLGVHRPTVSDTAQRIQAQGLIRYSRGVITITDREGLERAACECYGVMRDEFDAMRDHGS